MISTDQDVTSESTHSNHENFNVVTNPYAIYNGMESQINTADHAPDVNIMYFLYLKLCE